VVPAGPCLRHAVFVFAAFLFGPLLPDAAAAQPVYHSFNCRAGMPRDAALQYRIGQQAWASFSEAYDGELEFGFVEGEFADAVDIRLGARSHAGALSFEFRDENLYYAGIVFRSEAYVIQFVAHAGSGFVTGTIVEYPSGVLKHSFITRCDYDRQMAN